MYYNTVMSQFSPERLLLLDKSILVFYITANLQLVLFLFVCLYKIGHLIKSIKSIKIILKKVNAAKIIGVTKLKILLLV